MLRERVLQVWRWYLQRFRRYSKKTRGGLEIAPPRGARVKRWIYGGNIMLYRISVAQRGLTGIANIFRSRLSGFDDLLRAGWLNTVAFIANEESSARGARTRVWNGLDQSAGFIIQSSPCGFGLDWIRNSPTQRILDWTGLVMSIGNQNFGYPIKNRNRLGFWYFSWNFLGILSVSKF